MADTQYVEVAGARVLMAQNARPLIRYWTSGPGAARIRWGTPGDFNRCVRLVREYMSVRQAKGFCNLRHHDALGIWPAQH